MKKPTTIAHIVASLNVGGAERFVIDLCTAQIKRGMSPTIISLGSPQDTLVAEAQQKHIPVEVLEGGRTGKQLKLFLTLKRHSVLHVHSPHPLKFMSLMLPLLKNQTIIYTRHGAAPLQSKKWQRLHRHARPYINAVSFVSAEGAENFHSTHHWDGTPARVIDNGVNLDEMAPRPIDPDSGRIRLGSVGRMVGLKNQIGLLQAVAQLDADSRKGVEVHFFGDGECAEQLKAFHQQHLADTQVHFHGMVRNREQIYNSFDALVVTSETEGLSIAIIEAMAFQRPVIATRVGGNPRLVEDGVNGWLIPYDDASSLARRIQQLQALPAQRQAMGKAGREKVLAEFSIEATCREYETLYSL